MIPKPTRWMAGLIILFACLSIAMVVGGYTYHHREARALQSMHYGELKIIAELKTSQLIAWRRERLSDARQNALDPFIRSAILRWIRNPWDGLHKNHLLQHLELFRKNYGYQNVILARVDGGAPLTLHSSGNVLEKPDERLVSDTIASREIRFGDFIRNPDSGLTYLDVAAPILDQSQRVVAVQIIRTDPEMFLFPLLQSWPTPSPTAETLLLRRDGDTGLFLNRLRHRDSPALTVRIPMSHEEIPGVQALLGRVGEFVGIDYRGVKVLADLRSIPDSNWHMVAKVDLEEIQAESRYRRGVVFGFVSLGIVLLATVLVLLFFLGQASFYHELFRASRFNPQDEPRVANLTIRWGLKIAFMAGCFTICMGMSVLAGWWLEVPSLKSLLPGFVAMKANTALAFVLGGTSLALLATNRPSPLSMIVSRLCAIVAALIGLLTLIQYTTGVDLGIDQRLFHEPAGTVGTLAPGRMAPASAIAFSLLGGGLILASRATTTRIAQRLILPVGMIGLVALMGYLYGPVGAFGAGHYLQLALHTAFGFIVLTIGALFLHPENGLLTSFLDDSIGGWLLRRLTPLLLGMPILMGWLSVRGAGGHFFEGSIASALLVLFFMVLSMGTVLWVSRAIDQIDSVRRQAEVKIFESTEENRATLYSIGDGVIVSGADGRVEQMNPVAESLTGWTEPEAVGHPLADVFQALREDNRTPMESPVERVLREGSQLGSASHSLLVARDGSERSITDSAAPVRNRQGVITRVVLVFQDQTAAWTAQKALQASEVKYRRLHESMMDAFVRTDMDGRIQEYNRAFLEISRFPEAQLPYLAYEDITPAEFHGMEQKILQEQILPRGYSDVYEKVCRRGDGTMYHAELRVFLLRDDDGAPSGMWSIVRDITERKNTEGILRARTELLDLTGRMAKVGGWEYDIETGRGSWTDEVARIHDLDSVEGVTIESAIQSYEEQSRPVIAQAVREAIERGKPYDLELNLISAKGVRKTVRTMGAPMRDGSGKIVQIRGILHDITEMKAIEDQIRASQAETKRLLEIADQSRKALLSLLEDQRMSEEVIRRLNADLERRVEERTAELEAANKELEAFAYSVSHDLRAPLRHMDGFLSMLTRHLGDDLDEKGARYLEVTKKAAARMGQLVDGLLSFSRLGRAELHMVSIDTARLVASVIEEFKGEWSDRQVGWVIGTLPVLHGDHTLLRLVFQNLIGNAIKFTRNQAHPIIEILPIDGSAGEAGVMIRDNGAGFDQAYMHKLFGVFQRLHREDEFEGTGIGLANVHRIIDRHGGRVWAEGRPGLGAAFHFVLPGRQV